MAILVPPCEVIRSTQIEIVNFASVTLYLLILGQVNANRVADQQGCSEVHTWQKGMQHNFIQFVM